MLKKLNPKNVVVDVPADNPVGTMDRFAAGLKRVLAAPKPPARKSSIKRHRHG
jgi:hypothetical protein